MALKRRRENDETRKLGSMGEALGFDKPLKESRSVIPYRPFPEDADNPDRNVKFNEKATKRAAMIKDGSSSALISKRIDTHNTIAKRLGKEVETIQVNSGKK